MLSGCFWQCLLCCDRSRPDRFEVFGQMEEYSQSHRDVWHAFSQGWASPAHCKLCAPACLCVTHCMSPAPLCGSCHGTQWGAPTCLSNRDKQSQQKTKKLYNITWFCACEPTSCYGNHLSDPVPKLWECYLPGPFKVMGNCFPWLARHLGEEARLPPLTLHFCSTLSICSSLMCSGVPETCFRYKVKTVVTSSSGHSIF